MFWQALIRRGLAGVMLYLLSGLLIFTHADFEAPPPPPTSMYATHAGVTMINFVETTVQGDDFTSRDAHWTVETPSWVWNFQEVDVPTERAVWMLFRGSLIEQTFDGNPVLGENYALVHYALSGSATTTLNTEFEMQLLGDPDTPSGEYTLVVAELPETYFIFDEDIGDYVGERAYTDQDFVNWVARLDTRADPQNYRWLEFDYIAGEAPVGKPDPVIIIPGILGSEQVDGEWVIDPILHTYDDLIATLDANGYTPEEDLFSFPYNWRKSNVETAFLLKDKIDEVKGICECEKVDLVAHSMGGLVARQYIQSDDYEDDVDQLIFLGTPHLGAPKTYLMWEGGEVGPFFPLSNTLLKIVLKQEAIEEGYNDLFDYIQSKPISSVQELLPIYDYIFDGADLRDYPANHPANSFLEGLKNSVGDLLNSDTEVHNIVGNTGEPKTIIAIRATDSSQYFPMWPHGYPENFDSFFGDHGLELGDGDETVPLPSASFLDSNLLTIPYTHDALPTEAEGDVYFILTGKIAGVLSRQFDSFTDKLMHIQILSPADLLVVAPDGKKIGKNTNGQEINQIPNAFYTGFNTDTEFITILNPLDGEYKIFSQGTGSGSYTIETNFISEATTTDASFTGNTAPGIKSELNIEVQEGTVAPDSLEVVVTYESTLADLERIYALKWINAGIYKALKGQLQTAKKSKPFVAKILMQTMLKQLNSYRGKLLTEQAYQILKLDLELLINP